MGPEKQLLFSLGTMEVRGVPRRHSAGFRPYEIATYGIDEADIFSQQMILMSKGLLVASHLEKVWENGKLERVPVLRLTADGLLKFLLEKAWTDYGLDGDESRYLALHHHALESIYTKLPIKEFAKILHAYANLFAEQTDLKVQDTVSARNALVELIEKFDVPRAGRSNSEIVEDLNFKRDLLAELRVATISRTTVRNALKFIVGLLTFIATLCAVADSPVANLIAHRVWHWLSTIS